MPPAPSLPLRAIHYGPDDKGINGTYLGKDVVAEAGRGLTRAMSKVRGGGGRQAGKQANRPVKVVWRRSPPLLGAVPLIPAPSSPHMTFFRSGPPSSPPAS